MTLAVWILIFVLLSAFAVYAYRMMRVNDDEDRHDAGQAIIDFARAFPNEAIRSLHMTEDGMSVFVRLHGNKAGLMRNMGTHFACMLISGDSLRIQQLPDDRGFRADFTNAERYSGEFRFSTPVQAAEVTLWLLDSYVAPESENQILNGSADPAPTV